MIERIHRVNALRCLNYITDEETQQEFNSFLTPDDALSYRTSNVSQRILNELIKDFPHTAADV